MKKQLFTYIFLSYCLTMVAQVGEESALLKLATAEGKAAKHKLNPINSLATAEYDLNYHRCEWQVDPNINYIKGIITSYFKPVTANFTSIYFDMIDTLKVDSVKYHGSKLATSKLTGDLLKIDFNSTLPVGVIDSVTVYYQGSPGASGFGSFITAKHNTTDPVLWTLSEPFGAKEWWPCKQNLNDKIDSLDIIVTTPDAYRVASNGLLVNESASGNNKIYHWKTNYPIAAYLVAIAVTNYAVYYDFVPIGNKQLDVLNYVYPENLDAAKDGTKNIINIITLFNELAGDYPFAKEKYGHAQFNWGGGMEHQTMSFVVNFDYGLLAHECAHQWFGDNVTCGSWQDIWLNEGFATYLEGLARERYLPNDWKVWKSSKVAHITSVPGGSVLCKDTLDVSRIFDGRLSYNKGAYLLHMLRWKIGDAAFFKALKNYQNDPALRFGYAKTPHLIQHFEHTSGKNLSAFFEQWYYKEGYPTYKAELVGPCCNYTIKLNQEQSHPSVNFFEMPVPITFYCKGKDTTLVFDHTFSGQVFPVVLNQQIDSAKIDPEQWLLSGNNTITYTNIVSVNEFCKLSNDIILYPNPSTGNNTLTIENKNTVNEVKNVTITDVLGNMVKSFNMSVNANGKITLLTSELDIGIYFINLSLNNYTVSKKFIKL